jgi:hypothetical protein
MPAWQQLELQKFLLADGTYPEHDSLCRWLLWVVA